MISFDEAIALGIAAVEPTPAEMVPLSEAHGRVLASPVTAQVDSPPVDTSAMDGYAVRTADLGVVPATLSIVGQSLPGQGFEETVRSGTAVRLFTGAPIPAGCDRVVIQERVRRNGDQAVVQALDEPSYIRPRGLDFRAGDLLVLPGTRLGPRALVTAAGADIGHVDVHRRPRLHLLATGDELVAPGLARDRQGSVPESVSFGVLALAAEWGAEPVGTTYLPDDLDRMRPAAARACADADLVVVTGGASVGERDFARAMFDTGLELIFAKVAIKPGKPVWLGRVGSTIVLGLPGNPTSALVTARLFLAPLLTRLTGRNSADALRWRPAPLAEPLGSTGDRETFSRACLRDGFVHLLPNQESSAQLTLAQSELLVRRGTGVEGYLAWEPVPVLDF